MTQPLHRHNPQVPKASSGFSDSGPAPYFQLHLSQTPVRVVGGGGNVAVMVFEISAGTVHARPRLMTPMRGKLLGRPIALGFGSEAKGGDLLVCDLLRPQVVALDVCKTQIQVLL